MISYIEGKIADKNPAYAVVEAGGIGYALNISLNTFSKINELSACKLFVEQVYVRDDNPKWYGFFELDERELFRKLISVSGVGGGSALLMLSSKVSPSYPLLSKTSAKKSSASIMANL